MELRKILDEADTKLEEAKVLYSGGDPVGAEAKLAEFVEILNQEPVDVGVQREGKAAETETPQPKITGPREGSQDT